ncbi:MAG: hypothetical protein BGP09_05890 [Rhizobium sp. 60-20]|nr:MAG: hypothetical protein BGP09_05890 [Rhizobium sp. 60-20]
MRRHIEHDRMADHPSSAEAVDAISGLGPRTPRAQSIGSCDASRRSVVIHDFTAPVVQMRFHEGRSVRCKNRWLNLKDE